MKAFWYSDELFPIYVPATVTSLHLPFYNSVIFKFCVRSIFSPCCGRPAGDENVFNMLNRDDKKYGFADEKLHATCSDYKIFQSVIFERDTVAAQKQRKKQKKK